MESVDVLHSRLRIWRHDISSTFQNLPEAGLVFGSLGKLEGEARDRYGLHFDQLRQMFFNNQGISGVDVGLLCLCFKGEGEQWNFVLWTVYLILIPGAVTKHWLSIYTRRISEESAQSGNLYFKLIA